MSEYPPESIPVPLVVFNAYDASDAEAYSHVHGYRGMLWEIQEKLRSDEKLGEFPEPVYEYIEKFREFFYDLKSSYHLPE